MWKYIDHCRFDFTSKRYYRRGKIKPYKQKSIYKTCILLKGIGFDVSQYKNIKPWIERCKKLVPNYEEANQLGADEMGNLLLSKTGPIV